MDGLNLFIVLLVVVFAVLQIILFFKLWGMTNDIKAIKNKVPNNDRIRDAEIAFLSGNSDIAKKILDEYLKITIDGIKENHYSNELKIRKERIIDTYRYLGLSIPAGIE